MPTFAGASVSISKIIRQSDSDHRGTKLSSFTGNGGRLEKPCQTYRLPFAERME